MAVPRTSRRSRRGDESRGRVTRLRAGARVQLQRIGRCRAVLVLVIISTTATFVDGSALIDLALDRSRMPATIELEPALTLGAVTKLLRRGPATFGDDGPAIRRLAAR